ncbi:MAG: hypothetical protein ABSF83_04135 [Nitrososphaerales archaeon]
MDQSGAQVFAETSVMYAGDSISGTYTACETPASTTTTTVAFTSSTSSTSSTYQPSYNVSVIYHVLQPSECGRDNSICDYEFQIDWGARGGVDGASSQNQSFAATFPNCNTPLTYSFTLDAPLTVANLIFQIDDSSGNVVYQVDAATANSTNLQGSFQPSCSVSSSSSASSAVVIHGPESSIAPDLHVAFGFIALSSCYVSAAVLEARHSRRLNSVEGPAGSRGS